MGRGFVKRWRRRKPNYARIERLEDALGYGPIGGEPRKPRSPFSVVGSIADVQLRMAEMEARWAQQRRHALILKRGPLTDEERATLGVRS